MHWQLILNSNEFNLSFNKWTPSPYTQLLTDNLNNPKVVPFILDEEDAINKLWELTDALTHSLALVFYYFFFCFLNHILAVQFQNTSWYKIYLKPISLILDFFSHFFRNMPPPSLLKEKRMNMMCFLTLYHPSLCNVIRSGG